MATLEKLVELIPAQKKVWKRFEKAFKEFKAAGGAFYTVLETVHGYNGKHVKDIGNDGDYSLHFRNIGPSIMAPRLSGFADGEHFLTFKDGVAVEDDK